MPVEQPFVSSLEHRGADVIGSYLLHGPTQQVGLTLDDWAAWRGDGSDPRQRPSAEHMREDLAVFDFRLEPDEGERMERLIVQ